MYIDNRSVDSIAAISHRSLVIIMTEKTSIPLASPLYPKPPLHYEKSKLFLALFTASEKSMKHLIPEPLRPSDMNLGGMLFAEHPCKETGTFMETGILVQCMFDNPETGEEDVGVYFPFNYVDSDVAMAMGREVWGYPRKLASSKMEWTGNTLVGTTIRDEVTILKATCEFDDEGEFIESGPNINVKLIPSPTGEGFDVAVITAANTLYANKLGKSGDVVIEIQSGPRDNLSFIEIESPMIGLYFDTDILVPPAKIIAKLKL